MLTAARVKLCYNSTMQAIMRAYTPELYTMTQTNTLKIMSNAVSKTYDHGHLRAYKMEIPTDFVFHALDEYVNLQGFTLVLAISDTSHSGFIFGSYYCMEDGEDFRREIQLSPAVAEHLRSKLTEVGFSPEAVAGIMAPVKIDAADGYLSFSAEKIADEFHAAVIETELAH